MSIRRVLIANRGEIAVRVMRTCRETGLAGVAVYADSDRDAPFVRAADEAFPLGGSTPAETYLAIDKLIDVARRCGADAVHPGYGFLSENADFAQAVLDAGLTWVGPPPQVIRDLGDKTSARRIAARAGAPLVPGTLTPAGGPEDVVAFAREHGLPVAIKAAFGGGGRGLKIVRELGEAAEMFESATREAVAAFGRGECFLERYLDHPRHVEAQVLADGFGRIVVIGTRDCSVQRRHQKLVEEAPAPFLSAEQLATITESARSICSEAGYVGAGTVEYLLGADGTLSFLEVNTRIQVEHPVSEETTGIDLVREQFRIAAGEPLSLDGDPVAVGHSVEFRITAEDPGRGFLPAPGTVGRYVVPGGAGVRVDSGVEAGSVVDGRFDSLLAKLIVTGADRDQALRRARRALDEFVLDGLPTALPFHRVLVDDPAFVGDGTGFAVHTRWLESEFDNRIPPFSEPGAVDPEAPITVTVGGRRLRVELPGLAALGPERAAAIRAHSARAGGAARDGAAAANLVTSPMQGTVVKIAVEDGQQVEVGQLVATVEAMKMENPVTAHRSGVVCGLAVEVGMSVGQDALICEIK